MDRSNIIIEYCILLFISKVRKNYFRTLLAINFLLAAIFSFTLQTIFVSNYSKEIIIVWVHLIESKKAVAVALLWIDISISLSITVCANSYN